MLTMYRICKGIGIFALGGTLSFHCPMDLHEDKYAYILDQPHTHQEIRVSQNNLQIVVTNASSSYHSGEISYPIDMTASRDTSDGWLFITDCS